MKKMFALILLLASCQKPDLVLDASNVQSTTDPEAPTSTPASTPTVTPTATPTARTPGAPTDAEMSAHPEWFACQVNSDCQVAKISCCDSCNGGVELAINKAHTKDARAVWGRASCSGVSCTELECYDYEASCEANKCVAKLNGKIVPNPID